MDELLEALAEREARVEQGGGAARQARQGRLGRLTARERIEALVDEGSFVELGRYLLHRHAEADDALAANRHPGDGLVCGFARVDANLRDGVIVHAGVPARSHGGRQVVIHAERPARTVFARQALMQP